MEKLIIASTDEFPNVVLNPEVGKFEISGISIPHNSAEFYTPIIEWFKQYAKKPNQETRFECKLDYFNTSSHKYLTELFKLLDEMNKAHFNTSIVWYFNSEDEDMRLIGQELSNFLELPFEFKEY